MQQINNVLLVDDDPASNFLAQLLRAGHGRVLVPALQHVFMHQIHKLLRRVKIREALRQVYGLVLVGQLGHYRENACAGVRKF